jgi:serine/threonine protein kinase
MEMNSEQADTEGMGSGLSIQTPPPEPILGQVLVYVNQQLRDKFAIEQGEYILGRDSTCHIVINADEVSRHHARLTLSGFDLLIEDAGSSNGVFIDGVQVQIPTRVRPDQEVQIGSARLRIGLRESASRQLAEAMWDADLGMEPVRQMLVGKKYRVITTIGRGGMGTVMQARDMRIRRTVAMKVMKTGSQFSRESVLRFIDEAQLTGQLEHPNIVPVYELGVDEHGETFYAMKYVKGITLEEVLRGLRNGHAQMQAKYPLTALITVFQKICDAVAFAHSKGVVHRDLKPENVMLGAYGEVLVMDWGLAKHLSSSARSKEGGAALPAPPASLGDGRGFQTMHGLVVGTPPYVSPEQARGELDQIDARSDLFVLGGILYAILTLRPPVSGETVEEVLEKILAGPPPAPVTFNNGGGRRPVTEGQPQLSHCPAGRIPPGLSAVVMKAMELKAEDRYQSVEEMQEDVSAWQGGFPTKAERASLVKQIRLFLERHKAATGLFIVGFLVFNVLVLSFIYTLRKQAQTAKRNALEARKNEELARENAERARNSESRARKWLEQLEGTAPTYCEEAKNLMEEHRFEAAYEKAEFAANMVKNDPNYHLLRGQILQVLLRWEEAVQAFALCLKLRPDFVDAQLNLDLTKRLLEKESKGSPSLEVYKELVSGLREQRREDEQRYFEFRSPRNPDRNSAVSGPPVVAFSTLLNRAHAALTWEYGVGGWDPEMGRMNFAGLKVYNSERWQPGGGYPSSEYGFLAITKLGGVPGKDALNGPVRRWTSHVEGVVSVSGSFSHEENDGEPITVRVVSSRHGVLTETGLDPGADAVVSLEKVAVELGDTLDFVASSQSGGYKDGFKWRVEIHHREAGRSTDDVWASDRDFASKRELNIFEVALAERSERPALIRGKMPQSLRASREIFRQMPKDETGLRPALSPPVFRGNRVESPAKTAPVVPPPEKAPLPPPQEKTPASPAGN